MVRSEWLLSATVVSDGRPLVSFGIGGGFGSFSVSVIWESNRVMFIKKK